MQNPNFLTKFLEGNHIHLRPLHKGDLEYYYRRYLHPKVRQGQAEKQAFSPEQLEAWYTQISNDPTRLDLIISVQRDYEAVGTVTLKNMNLYERFALVEVTIPSVGLQNKGFATEAVYLVAEHAFEMLNLHRLEAFIPAYNKAALAVAEKLGFQTEGQLRQRLFSEGQYADVWVVSLLQTEFLESKHAGKYLNFRSF